MMDRLFARLNLIDVRRDVMRNIVSLRSSQDLFDDLADDPAHWKMAQRVEDAAKPPPYRSAVPVTARPFEAADWFNAIDWPFKNWQKSRFSNGSFGLWYGSSSIKTTIHETVYHWYHGLLSDAGFERETVVSERRLYRVNCHALLLDFRPLVSDYPGLIHKTDYSLCRMVGARIHSEGHPGLTTLSARHENGENFAVFNPRILSNPRHSSYLTCRLDGPRITVEMTPGKPGMIIQTDNL